MMTIQGDVNELIRLAAAAPEGGRHDDYGRYLEALAACTPEDDANHVVARHSLAALRLQQGDFSAFGEFDRWLYRRSGWADFLERLGPRWDGGPLAGRTILAHTVCEGHGDAFMFARYLPALRASGAAVRLACYPSQARLFAASGAGLGLECIIPAGIQGIPPEALDYDVHIPVMSLPAAFGTTLETVPGAIPYLTPVAGAVEYWRPAIEAIPGRLKVGIAWQGDPRQAQDRYRSLQLAEPAPLAEVPGVSLISLQKGPGSEQLAGAPFPVADLGPDYQAGDWLDTAAVVAQLDLVVTPDTAICHLAGALGRPVWAALSNPAEWRWMRGRPDSQWYPSMRLFRQAELGQWGPVFRRMAEALHQRGE